MCLKPTVSIIHGRSAVVEEKKGCFVLEVAERKVCPEEVVESIVKPQVSKYIDLPCMKLLS